MATLKPRDNSSLASDELMIPLPNDEATPPVVKIYFVSAMIVCYIRFEPDRPQKNKLHTGKPRFR
jgi:hypothetical protein